MKKLFTMLFAVMMLFSLAACSEKEPAEDKTITQNVDVQVNLKDENVELEETLTEQTMLDALTELGYGDRTFKQTVNAEGMISWAGTIINPENEAEAAHGVNLYAVIFNYTGSPDAAEAKLHDMQNIKSDFQIFMADIEDEMVVVIGGNDDYYETALTLIQTMGYQTK